MLITGIDACSASSSTGRVRARCGCPTAWTMRESTSAVSRTDSPRASCSSPSRSTTRVAAELVHAHLERDARAGGGLVEDERDAASRRARARRAGRAFSSRARSSEPGQLVGRKLLAGQEVSRHRCVVRVELEPLPRPRLPPDPALRTALALLRATSATPRTCRSTARCERSSGAARRRDWTSRCCRRRRRAGWRALAQADALERRRARSPSRNLAAGAAGRWPTRTPT